MSGEYSFAEALRELKECRSQLAQRESQVAELTALTNALQIREDDVAEENELLRSEELNFIRQYATILQSNSYLVVWSCIVTLMLCKLWINKLQIF
jgi:hypothetical protein